MALRWTASAPRHCGARLRAASAHAVVAEQWRQQVGVVREAVHELVNDTGAYLAVLRDAGHPRRAATCGGTCGEDYEARLVLHSHDLVQAAGQMAHPAADHGVFDRACSQIASTVEVLERMVEAAYSPCPDDPRPWPRAEALSSSAPLGSAQWSREARLAELQRLDRIATEYMEAGVVLDSAAWLRKRLPQGATGPRTPSPRNSPREALADIALTLAALECDIQGA